MAHISKLNQEGGQKKRRIETCLTDAPGKSKKTERLSCPREAGADSSKEKNKRPEGKRIQTIAKGALRVEAARNSVTKKENPGRRK